MFKPLLFLVATICGQDLATGAWDRECSNYAPTEPVADCRDAGAMAAWLNSTSPAGVRVIAWACVGPDTRQAGIFTPRSAKP